MIFEENIYNLVTGETLDNLSCEYARQREDLCGYIGKWFKGVLKPRLREIKLKANGIVFCPACGESNMTTNGNIELVCNYCPKKFKIKKREESATNNYITITLEEVE